VSGANFNNAWSKARAKAVNQLENRLNRGLPAFSPSPPKPKAKTSPNVKKSPRSGRAKIKSANTGRWVYANLQPMNFLKALAANKGINVKGIRSKAEIARKIFG
jgi:hypothetical protein